MLASRARQDQDAVAWVAVVALALVTWVLLATAGRLPSADVPQHALALRRLLEGPGELFRIRWEFPYTLLYAIAALPAQWIDPVSAIGWTAALSMALLPVAGATLASALGRSPSVGAFAMLGSFTMVSGWGFFAVVLGASVSAFAVAVALRYARRPSLGRGLALVAMMLLSYAAHPMASVATLGLSWAVVPVWCRTLRRQDLWPLVVGTLLVVALWFVWLTGTELPWLARQHASWSRASDGPFLYRIVAIAHFATAFGRVGALIWPWWLLAGCLLAALTSDAVRRRHLLARGRRMPLSRAAAGERPRRRLRRTLQRVGPPGTFLALLVLYLVVPVWLAGVFMVYPRFLVFAFALAPLLVGARRGPWRHAWGMAAMLPALWLVVGAAGEVRHNAERTECIDRLLAQVRPGEATLTLAYRLYPEGYLQPLDLHVAAELAARRGGWVGLTFTDFATVPVAYAPGVEREVAPPNVTWDARAYEHATHGQEFTAWVLIDAPQPVEGTVARVFGPGPYEVAQCAWLTLVRDTSVAPGGRPHRRFLPHRAVPGHPQ